MDALRQAHALADVAYDTWQDLQGRRDLADEVAMGADGTATSRGDKLVETAMLEVAVELGIDVLSEEAGRVGKRGGVCAVIDPIDGTRNAGRGIPFFCTSVAVGHDALRGTQAGVVRSLVTGDTYAAAAGQGATLNGKSVVHHKSNKEDIIVALIADYADVDTVTDIQKRNWHMRDLGSAALELCLVGTGAMDAFHVPRDWLRVIDIAAGTLFVEEAGGRVVAPGTRDPLDVPYDLTVRTGLTAVHDERGLEVFD